MECDGRTDDGPRPSVANRDERPLREAGAAEGASDEWVRRTGSTRGWQGSEAGGVKYTVTAVTAVTGSGLGLVLKGFAG
jgi:hypothetical protein